MSEDKIIGVYSTRSAASIGTGMTRRKTVQKRYWIAYQSKDGGCAVEPLNSNLVPTGGKRNLPVEEFEERFEEEPEFFFNPEAKKIRKVWKAELDKGTLPQKDAARSSEAPPAEASAEAPVAVPEPDGSFGLDLDESIDFEDDEPLGFGVDDDEFEGSSPPPELADQDEPIRRKDTRAEAAGEEDEQERSARADFGIGLAYLKRGDKDKAQRIFEELADRKGEWEIKHKYMFNDFGIGLRKSRLGETAIRHYERALELSPEDEHLYHNMARVYYELGDTNNAVRSLKKSLDINPDLKESKQFLDFIRRKQASRSPLKLDI